LAENRAISNNLTDWKWNDQAYMQRVEAQYIRGIMTATEREEKLGKPEIWKSRLTTKLTIDAYEAEYGMNNGWPSIKACLIEGDELCFYEYTRFEVDNYKGLVVIRNNAIVAIRPLVWAGKRMRVLRELANQASTKR